MDTAQESDLAPFFVDLSQSEKLSEIKLPLVQCKICTFGPKQSCNFKKMVVYETNNPFKTSVLLALFSCI